MSISSLILPKTSARVFSARSVVFDRHRRCHVGGPDRVGQRGAIGQPGGEHPVERVSGSGGVDHLCHGPSREALLAAIGDEQGAGRPLGDDDRTAVTRGQLVEGGRGLIVADGDHELVLVGCQDRSQAEDLGRQRAGRGGVEDRPHPGLVRRPQGGGHHGGRDLVVGEEHVGPGDPAAVVVAELPGVVRAGRDGDLVLAARADDDERHPRRLSVDGAHAVELHAVGAQRLDRPVRALAAVMGREPSAEHGLAGGREVVDRNDEVDVHRSDDADTSAHAGSMPHCSGRRALPSSPP
jgi:hypothetical protein